MVRRIHFIGPSHPCHRLHRITWSSDFAAEEWIMSNRQSQWARTSCWVLTALLLFVGVRTLEAQGLSPTEVQALAQELEASVRRMNLQPLAGDPSVSALGAAPTNQVVLEVSKEGTAVGRARLAFPIGIGSSLDVVMKGPLSSGEGLALDSRGLSDGASIRVGFHQLFWTKQRDTLPEAFRAAAPTQTFAASTAGRVADALLSAAAGVAGADAARLTTIVGTYKSDHGRAGLRELADRATADGLISGESTFFLDAGYEKTAQAFEFTNLSDLAVSRVNESGDTVALTLGYGRTGGLADVNTKQPLIYAAMSFQGGRGYRGSAKQQICLPVPGTVATRCSSIATAGPREVDVRLWTFELRRWIRQQKLGLNPVFTRDDVNDVSALQLNVSALVFKKDDKGRPTFELDGSALTTGVRFGYNFNGDQKGASFSIFFGSVLGLW